MIDSQHLKIDTKHTHQLKKKILIKIQSLIFKDPVFEINTVKLFDLYNISQAKWYTTNNCHKIPQPVTCVKKTLKLWKYTSQYKIHETE